MRWVLVIWPLLFGASAFSQVEHFITFAGSGESSSVSTVRVENLANGQILTLNGTDILHLIVSIPTRVAQVIDKSQPGLKLFPNPMIESTVLEIYFPEEQSANISIIEITGKLIFKCERFLTGNMNKFRIYGLKKGLYLVNVRGKKKQLSEKLISNSNSEGIIRIEEMESEVNLCHIKDSVAYGKGIQASVDMEYTSGSRLKFTGISGQFSTVKTDIPSENKTITFDFVACTDADNNSYPIVTIGTQIWMAENLRTTKYKNGDLIGTTINPYEGLESYETILKCQWPYNGVEDNVLLHGRLYTWYTANDIRGVCPTGWHLPSEDDWTDLKNFLIQSGFNWDFTLEGNKIARSISSISGWNYSPIYGSPGNSDFHNNSNASGFSAIPGGYRYTELFESQFNGLSGNAAFWSSAWYGNPWETGAFNISYAKPEGLINSHSSALMGFSIRCLKD